LNLFSTEDSALRFKLFFSYIQSIYFQLTQLLFLVMASIKLRTALSTLHVPLALCHTASRLPHPALSLRGTSELGEAGTTPCSHQPPATTEVQVGICSSPFQESVTGCYSDKQVGLLGKRTKH